ncbi:hypothetical protein ACFX14_037796 [Malus domestica]
MNLTDGLSFGGVICPQTFGEFIWPFSLLVGERLLKAVDDRLLGCFGLPIALRISMHGHVLLDAILFQELRHIFAYELRGVVCDDGLKMPNRQMLFLHMKHSMSICVMVVMGFTSTHLVK